MLRLTTFLFTVAAIAGGQTARPRPVAAGAISQVAAGGPWKTAIVLFNPTWNPQEVTVRFHAADGSALEMPIWVSNNIVNSFGTTSETTRVIEPLGILRIDTDEDARAPVRQGWAEVISRVALIGSARFMQRMTTGGVSEAVAPLDYNALAGITLAYDNTLGQATGLAMANMSGIELPLQVVIRDENGSQIGSAPFSLRASGHAAFDISRQFGVPAGRGIVEILGPSNGRLAGIALRFTSAGTFTSVPVLKIYQLLPLNP